MKVQVFGRKLLKSDNAQIYTKVRRYSIHILQHAANY